ncbi:MAG: hypothetical protein HSCHL_2359 [Hydrogenibacillus schlegelii]|uniref:Uncharacterized protein n=1 Tax=Hydrogenibacillus schlegelii TaxID=1484 RepID=A0A2T5GF09_HYDSH|nr:MAG: hypothetical protein HSCHL_2359 [Hydrogenibacillus schlegelii]
MPGVGVGDRSIPAARPAFSGAALPGVLLPAAGQNGRRIFPRSGLDRAGSARKPEGVIRRA